MSANPTRVACLAPSPLAERAFPVQEGNRVLESLARQEALRALMAFSDLHEQIRNRRADGVAGPDADLFQTERFVLDEVLQLICDRMMTITHADGVLVALPEGSGLVCRASAGPMAVVRGVRLPTESEFLQDCLDSGRILRCDDCDIDARVELDLARGIGARSAVLVPLRGARERLGVLQAFSNVPFAFTDDDVRCFDLFGELVLSALKPEDQDRRLNWLTDVVQDVLGPKPASGMAGLGAGSPGMTSSEIKETESFIESRTALESGVPPQAVEAGFEDSDTWDQGSTQRLKPALLLGVSGTAEAVPFPKTGVEPSSDLEVSSNLKTSPDFGPSSGALVDFEAGDSTKDKWTPTGEVPAPFLAHLANSRSPHPGLSVVLVLIAVAGLFSAGVWFGMRHQDAGPSKASDSASALPLPTRVSGSSVSDHLMDPAKADAGENASKLSVLPKITGVRHWSTPMGSTVVIDMQDQAPYEVHRLMSPERIYFDIHDTALVSGLDGTSIDVGDVALSRVRVAQPVPGVTRVVLDTRDGSNFSISMESNPYRLVVELRGADRALASNRGESRTAAAFNPLPLRPEDNQLRAKTGRLRIALDAGHGGWDLGTVGRNGLQEKDLVLDVTRRLGKMLQARLGSDVIFTRTGDTYLPLDERADFANQAQADLFVSVHANYSSAASARGVETYYTNTFTAPGSRDVQNPESMISPPLTPVSMSNGELHDKIEESRRLAASIQRSLFSTLAINSPGIRDRGVKDSQFVVLTGTTMPSILTEISFVSSPADERNLQSETYRQQIAEALYKGIARYAATAQHHVKVAEVQRSAAIGR